MDLINTHWAWSWPWQDTINGMYELLAGSLIGFNIRRLYIDKKVRGVSTFSTIILTSWGYWNLYYYPYLNQWLSFFGGLSMVIFNTIWVIQIIYYNHLEKRRR